MKNDEEIGPMKVATGTDGFGPRAKAEAQKKLFVGLCGLVSLACSGWSADVGTMCFGWPGFPSMAVTNSLTGERVVAGTTFLAGLYYAPDGVVDPALFIHLTDGIDGTAAADVGFVSPGFFDRGCRAVPLSTPPRDFAEFQIRVWEAAYGPTYEQAASAPDLFGRPALRGVSNIVRAQTGEYCDGGGSECLFAPQDLVRAGLQTFVIEVPEPSTLSVTVMIAGLLCLLHRSSITKF